MKKRLIIIAVILGILSMISIESKRDVPDGAVLFERERCIYCHSFKGRGEHVGPDLTEVAKRRSDEWLKDQIRNPRLHAPDSLMPPHEYLSRKEIKALIKFLKS